MNIRKRIHYRFFAVMSLMMLSAAVLLGGCDTVELKHMGGLSSYTALKRSNGLTTQSEFFVHNPAVDAAKTVSIIPTTYARQGVEDGLDVSQREILTNMIDRSLCQGLSSRFQIVQPNEPADLRVHAFVTDVRPTDVVISGASKVIGVLPSLLSAGVPVPIPRIPAGLGSLSVEAEAIDGGRAQAAAMVWARQADVVTGRARLSKVGDAYDLAGSFGEDFSKLIVSGSDPMKDGVSLPSVTELMTRVGIDQKRDQCKRFGDNPGLQGFLGGAVGLPPEWLDKGK